MEFEEEKERLIRSMIMAGSLKTEKIIEAFRKIPRHLFVTEEYLKSAYLDVALPTIGGSTISQPTTVAIMTEALQPKKGEKILEVGTGSGWQACLLAYCVGSKGKIVTIDIDPKLIEFAKKNIKKFNVKNIRIICCDGSVGYEKEAPFDRIMVTAACPAIPKPLIEQLKIKGRMVVPVGPEQGQRMLLVDKLGRNKLVQRDIGEFVFVKLVGKYGFK
ncbi:MAG: protein-L-isoaspartate(D-aspartate) O-methyltransferase [Candidatus Aenigmarchaeota archaeon]|nr:protein-L-isoaspartate(D-aspartate) O-methyltransferase [Candidatus Aenigmarchaeota archaeon]